MSMPSAVLRRGAAALCALLAAIVLAAAPVRAQDAATPPAKPAAGAKAEKSSRAKPAAKPAAAPAAKGKTATKAKAAPKPKPAPLTHEEQVKEDGPWASQTNWLCMRAGYAKSTALNSGDALVGYGIAFQHMLDNKWSFGGSVQHDVLGHLGTSTEIAVPFTVELTRHFKWNTAIRPYVGFGAGYYFHKYYRTGTQDTGAPGSGEYLCWGANMPLSSRHVLGLDVRTSFMSTREGVVNPVFGPENGSETLWSAKLTWGMYY